jgi:hypothetical protein
MPPGKHAKLGASGARRWRNCSGSINLSEGQPNTTSIYAAEGTVAHEIGEKLLRHGQGANVQMGGPILQDGFTIEITDEMLEAVQVYVDFVSEQAEGHTLLLEQQFDLAPLSPPGPMYGTADAVVWNEEEKHLHVIDYKHGAGIAVDAEKNDQGLVYVLGAVVEFGRKPDTMTFTIVQPRAFHEDGEIRSWDLTWDELTEAKRDLFIDAEATLYVDAPLEAGDWCRFCPAHAICPAQRSQALALAQDAFAVEPTFPAVETMSLVDIAEVLDKGGDVQDWIKSVGAYALNMLKNGEEIPGYKLVEKRTNRRWVDPDAAMKYLKSRRLKVDERYVRKPVSPAQAEKVLKAKGGRALPESLVEKPEGGPALASIEDKRPEKLSGMREAFGVLETGEK